MNEIYNNFFAELKIDDLALGKLQKYASLLMSWNEKINVTGCKTDEGILYSLISDTLAGWHTLTIKNILKNRYKIADIGAGGGIAGIPIALTNSDYNVCLVESNKKKCMVLEDIKQGMSLENISIVHGRAESVGRNPSYREQYDVVVAKAVSALSILVELSFPLLKVGGILAAYKSKSVSEEIDQSKEILNIMNGEILGCYEYDNPITKSKNTSIIICKNDKTSDDFPRRIGAAQKRPV